MMDRQTVDQGQLFYLFNLERRIPESHLLRRINPTVTRMLAEFREQLEPFYSEIGRPSIDPELMIRILIVGYCYGIRFERKLCEEVELHLTYRWFCRLDLETRFPATQHSPRTGTVSARVTSCVISFERVVMAAMAMGLVKGEGFAVDASVMEAQIWSVVSGGNPPGSRPRSWDCPAIVQYRKAGQRASSLRIESSGRHYRMINNLSTSQRRQKW
jgi:transposase